MATGVSVGHTNVKVEIYESVPLFYAFLFHISYFFLKFFLKSKIANVFVALRSTPKAMG